MVQSVVLCRSKINLYGLCAMRFMLVHVISIAHSDYDVVYFVLYIYCAL